MGSAVRPVATLRRHPAERVRGPGLSACRAFAGDTGRRYLAYSTLGCIVLKQEEDHNVVEVRPFRAGADARPGR